ncbi:MAG: DUF5050 domain-containing protein [Clostridia bacterium]|nr:DUF5050 domain-containing protein [Clostridia bacterium]
MKNALKILTLALTLLLAGTSIVWAEESGKKSLDQVFEKTVIVPFDYHEKVFLHGKKTDVYGDYKLYQKNGRVLVPIRLMGYLADQVDPDGGYWQVTWDSQKPNDVILSNYQLQKTVKLKVNNKTMYINNEPKTLDIAPQKIGGRIVLPLRSTAEALGKNIDWLNGLIILGNEPLDLQNPQTLEIAERIKGQLADKRKEVDFEKRVNPIAKYENTVYYIKTRYLETDQIEELYSKTANEPEVKIALPGEKRFANYRIINDELYYLSTIDGQSELHIFNFADNKSRKLCALGDWHVDDGWLANMEYLNNDFYIILHSGDLTMGWERLYKLEDGSLKEITGAKSFISLARAGDCIYYTDFHPMGWSNNLYQVDLKTGEEKAIGDPDFTYGISRRIYDDGSVSYGKNSDIQIRDDYLYTVGYRETDQKDKSSVYTINLKDKTPTRVTPPVRDFWLVEDNIYYIDLETGYLVRVDLEGNNKMTLVEKRIINIKFYNENIYYTAIKENDRNAELGKLYKYNLISGQETKLSDKSVSSFFVGRAGVFYQAEGYDLGLYKINESGRSLSIVDDSIYSTLLTDSGMVYTLHYRDGVFTAK